MMRNRWNEDGCDGSLPGRWQDARRGPGGFWWGVGLTIIAVLLVAAATFFAGSNPDAWWEWVKGMASWPLVFAWNFAGFFIGGFVWPFGGGGPEGGSGGVIWVGGVLLNWGFVAWILTKLVGKIFRAGGSQSGEERESAKLETNPQRRDIR